MVNMPHVASHSSRFYAVQVANGYRRPIPSQWPSSLRTLIGTCWAEVPERRPAMKLVLRTLTDLQSQPEQLRNLDPKGGAGMTGRMSSAAHNKGCCVVM